MSAKALAEAFAAKRRRAEVVPQFMPSVRKDRGLYFLEELMNIKERATKTHESGFNCAQSVFCACEEYTQLDEKVALAVSGGFGGGLRCGEVCGAVSGGVMALGMVCQYNDSSDLATKAEIAALASDYTSKFEAKYGCIRCVDLKKRGHPCKELIEYAAQLAEDMIKEK